MIRMESTMSSTLHVRRVVVSAFCIICPICIGNRRSVSKSFGLVLRAGMVPKSYHRFVVGEVLRGRKGLDYSWVLQQ
jgi:hypothetical protein